jgi:methionyl-tRNA formyltransferase
VRCLKVLLAGGVDVALVVTHEDSATENLVRIRRQPVPDRGHPYITPPDAKSAGIAGRCRRPSDMLQFTTATCCRPAAGSGTGFNMHGRCCRNRGRAPVNWAVLHGATETGATLHEMTVKPDAGAIVSQMVVPILPDDTAFEVFGKVTVAAEQALCVLPSLLDGTAPRLHNDLSKGGYFSGRKPEDGRIDWHLPAQQVYNLHRAVAPLISGRLHRCQRVARDRAAPV